MKGRVKWKGRVNPQGPISCCGRLQHSHLNFHFSPSTALFIPQLKMVDRVRKPRRPDIRRSNYDCWGPLGIKSTQSRPQEAVIMLIKRVYAPLVNDYLVTRDDVEDASGILQSQFYRNKFREGCRERLGELPAVVRNHQPDREKLVGFVYDVLRCLVRNDIEWINHMDVPRGSNKISKEDSMAYAAHRRQAVKNKEVTKSSSPSGHVLRGSRRTSLTPRSSLPLRVSPRSSVPLRVSPRTPKLSLDDPARVPSSGSRLALRAPASTPRRRQLTLRVSPRVSLPAPLPAPSVAPSEQPRSTRPRNKAQPDTPSGSELGPRLKDLMRQQSHPHHPTASSVDRNTLSFVPATRSKDTTARATVQSDAHIQPVPEPQPEEIEQEAPRPPRPPRPVKRTPQWDAEYRKRLIPLRFHNRGSEYDLLDQDWVMDSDPFDENYGLRDPALGSIFGPPEEPKYAKHSWEKHP